MMVVSIEMYLQFSKMGKHTSYINVINQKRLGINLHIRCIGLGFTRDRIGRRVAFFLPTTSKDGQRRARTTPTTTSKT